MLEETYNYKSPYWAMRSVGSKSLLGQFCCSACREKWIREREADHLKNLYILLEIARVCVESSSRTM